MVERRFPDVAEVSFDDVYADLPPAGRWVAVSMVASLDGAVTVDGRSGGLGGEGDRAVFRSLRDVADVILVGAGTARIEDYGPPRPRAAERRQARGQTDRAALAIVSRRLDLNDRLFEDPGFRPIVLTITDAPSDRREALARRGAEVVAVGTGDVDLGAAVDHLGSNGMARILCEGGPTLNGQLFTAGLVDEIFVTVAPAIVGGDARRIVAGGLPATLALDLVEIRVHDSEVHLRYRVSREGSR
jgi:riboflavin biosynthesis pyrimidine reductase